MPEELTLLQCPACGASDVVMRVDTRAYGFCPACGMCGPCAPNVNAEYAIRQWNALPRALRWADNPPQVPGWYWYKTSSHLGITKFPELCDRPREGWQWAPRNEKVDSYQERGGTMSEELTLRGAKAWIPHQLPPRTGGIVITLKPCPVCNGSAYTECRLATTFVGIVEMWRVSCDKVGCPAKTPLFDTLKEAVDAWNSQSGQNASRPLASSERLG